MVWPSFVHCLYLDWPRPMGTGTCTHTRANTRSQCKSICAVCLLQQRFAAQSAVAPATALFRMQWKISRPMTTAHQLQPQSMDLEQFKTISYFCWCTIILCWDGRARIVCMRNGKWLFSESYSAHFPFSLGLYMVRMIDRRRVYFNQAN